MKKILLFAIAAATMAVGCQKIQSLVNPDNTPVDENNPVEIKFNTNISVVETKSVESLDGLTLKVYGINNDNSTSKRQFFNIDATAGTPTQEGEPPVDYYPLTLDKTYYYGGNNEEYSFYGYYLDAATVADDQLSATPYTATVTIDGTNDILVATAKDNGTYTAALARTDNKQPTLEFKHALSQFKFAAINLGSESITLNAIKVKSYTSGVMTVVAETPGVAVNETTLTYIPVTLDALTLASQKTVADPKDGDYTSVTSSSKESVVMVYPNTTYELYLTLTQGNDERTLKVDLNNAIGSTTKAGVSYLLQLKLYSLEEIKITATLAPWEVQKFVVNTDSAEEVEPEESGDDNGEPEPEA